MPMILMNLKHKSDKKITLILSILLLSMMSVSYGAITIMETQPVFASIVRPDIYLECVAICETGQSTQGPKGDKGDTGDQGPQGERGPAGEDGASCPNTTTLHNRNDAGGASNDPSPYTTIHDSNHTANPTVCVPE